MASHPLDPRRVNVFFDANAFDRLDDSGEVDRLLLLRDAGRVRLIAPSGVRQEVDRDRTPGPVREAVSRQLFSFDNELNCDEQNRFDRICAIMQGNAITGKHVADARHIFEAAKYGAGYFITHDRRIAKTKCRELEAVLPHMRIVSLNEFLAIYEEFDSSLNNAELAARTGMPAPVCGKVAGEDPIATRDRDKTIACQKIEAALSALAGQQREPNEWELECLADAIEALYRGQYKFAMAKVDLMAERPDPNYKPNRDVSKFSLASLGRDFRAVAAEPVRQRPHFGPIV